MAKVTLAQTNFNTGEISPLALGRIDVDKYASACESLENFIPLIQGPITRRPGTKYITRTINNSKSLLISFKSSTTKVFLLEFYSGGIRVFLDGGVTAQIDAPWQESDLFSGKGECALSYVQSSDVLYICSKNYPPQKLAAYSNTKWELIPLYVQNGPFKEINDQESNIVNYSKTRGPFDWGYALTATTGIFAGYKCTNKWQPTSIPFYFGEDFNDSANYWTANIDYTLSADEETFCRNDGNNYLLKVGGKSGYVAPAHTIGTKKDGNPGCSWQFCNASFDISNWEYGSDKSISISPLSLSKRPNVSWVSSSNWALFAWLPSDGYPTHVCFFRNRLVFARQQTIWFSKTNDYENFAATDFGEIVDDCAITIDIQNGDTNQISFLYPSSQGLIVGTTAGLTMISEASITESFSPLNILATQVGGVGAAAVNPLRVGTSNIFVQRTGKILRDAQFDTDNSMLQAININLLNDTITDDGIIQTALVEIPQQIIWNLTSKGKLIGLTFEKEQQVFGWHRHELGGNAIIESIAVLPALDGSYDQLYLTVLRKYDSVHVRTLECLQPISYTQDSINAWMVDCGYRVVNSTPISTVTNLDFPDGTKVDVTLDGAPVAKISVINSTVELPSAAKNILIGLGYSSKVKLVPPMGGSQTGVSMGKKKRIGKIILKLISSLGGSIGSEFKSLLPLDMRLASNKLNESIPLFTGEYEVNLSLGFTLDQTLCITQEQALPFTLVAVVMEIEVMDRN